MAIKKITPMAKTAIDAKHTLREIRLQRLLGRHRNASVGPAPMLARCAPPRAL